MRTATLVILLSLACDPTMEAATKIPDGSPAGMGGAGGGGTVAPDGRVPASVDSGVMTDAGSMGPRDVQPIQPAPDAGPEARPARPQCDPNVRPTGACGHIGAMGEYVNKWTDGYPCRTCFHLGADGQPDFRPQSQAVGCILSQGVGPASVVICVKTCDACQYRP